MLPATDSLPGCQSLRAARCKHSIRDAAIDCDRRVPPTIDTRRLPTVPEGMLLARQDLMRRRETSRATYRLRHRMISFLDSPALSLRVKSTETSAPDSSSELVFMDVANKEIAPSNARAVGHLILIWLRLRRREPDAPVRPSPVVMTRVDPKDLL